MPEPILALVGDGVIRREELLRQWISPEWQIVRYRESLEDSHRVVAAIGMPAALAWKDIFPELRFLQLPGAGLDGLEPRTIPLNASVSNVYEHEGSIAEYVFAAIFARESRWLLESQHQLKQGNWPFFDRIGNGARPSLTRKSFGVCGWGRIGKRCADIAKSLNMHVVAFSRSPARTDSGIEFVSSVQELAGKCDFFLLSLPLNDETKGFIDKQVLRAMRPDAVLINVSRAGLVDEADLYLALSTGQIGGAILDVWYRYPASQNEKITGSQLAFEKLDNTIITPHLAANTDDMVERRWKFMAENMNRFLRNEAVLSRINLGWE